MAWLVVEEGDGADMTLPNHSRRPAKMKEQVVQDDRTGFQKKRLWDMKCAGGGRTLFGTVVLGEELAVRPGLQLRKVERKVIVAEQNGGNMIPLVKG